MGSENPLTRSLAGPGNISLLLLIHAWFPLKAVHFIILAKPTTFFSSEARTTMLQRLIRENGALRSFRLPLGQPYIS